MMVMATDGGSQELDNNTMVEITPSEIIIGDVFERLVSPNCGAVSMFAGTTRAEQDRDGRVVVRLEYEAYESMAITQLRSICSEARLRWPSLAKIAIVHRVGSVAVTETSVVVAVASPHRQEAIAAVAFLVERLKAEVTIWKKEVYDDGRHVSAAWKENAECPWRNA